MTDFPTTMKYNPILFSLSLFVFTAASAQKPNAPVRSATVAVGDLSYAACGEGIVATVWAKRNDFKLMTLASSGERHERKLDLAMTGALHYPLNGVAVINGKPCVFHDRWDKKTGVVSLFAQRYAMPGLEPEGPEVAIGEIPLDPKSYQGMPLSIGIKHSPDGKKTLLMFDKIQQGGIKLALCWVLDNDLNVSWGGGYRLPVSAEGSSTDYWVMNNGHVYYRVHASVLEEDDIKEKKDGSLAVKNPNAMHRRRSNTTWYELQGETFNQWTGNEGEGPGALTPVQHGDRVLFAGLGRAADQEAGWVLYDAGTGGLAPQKIAGGPFPNERSRSVFMVPGREVAYAGMDGQGDIYIAYVVQDGTRMVKVNTEGTVLWNKLLPWDNARFFPLGEKLASYRLLTSGNTRKALAGDAWGEPSIYNNAITRPVLFTIDADGNHRAMEVLPEDERVPANDIKVAEAMEVLEGCGCYVYHSNHKSGKGLARVDFSE